jgi:hypothetical protein
MLTHIIDRLSAWLAARDRERAQRDALLSCAFGEHGALAVSSQFVTGGGTAVRATCTTCGASVLDALRMTPDADGLLHITNRTPRDLLVLLGGAYHVLLPETERHRAQFGAFLLPTGEPQR